MGAGDSNDELWGGAVLAVPHPGKGTGYPAPSPQIRTCRFPASGSSVLYLFTGIETIQATPRMAHDYATLSGAYHFAHFTGIW
jgi:hypothetical protein